MLEWSLHLTQAVVSYESFFKTSFFLINYLLYLLSVGMYHGAEPVSKKKNRQSIQCTWSIIEISITKDKQPNEQQ